MRCKGEPRNGFRRLRIVAHEKGFRDALIWQTLLQFVEQVQVEDEGGDEEVRVIFVTKDERLSEAVAESTEREAIVAVAATLDQAREMVSEFVAEVDAGFVEQHQAGAESYFYDSESQRGLFVDGGVTAKLLEEHAGPLAELPTGAVERELGAWFVSSPRFAGRDGDGNVRWNSTITITSAAYRPFAPSAEWSRRWGKEIQATRQVHGHAWTPSRAFEAHSSFVDPIASSMESSLLYPSESYGVYNLESSPLYSGSMTPKREPARLAQAIRELLASRDALAYGTSKFDVTWSAKLEEDGSFTKGAMESMEFVETVWETGR